MTGDGITTFGLPCSLLVERLPGLPDVGVEVEELGGPPGRPLIHAELVVRVAGPDGAWIGNVATGDGFDAVCHTPDPDAVLVIGNGAGWFVGPGGVVGETECRTIAKVLADGDTIVLVDRDAYLEAYGPDLSVRWRERVVPQELVVEGIEDGVITGHGHDPATGEGVSFTCDVADGAVRYTDDVDAWWRSP